MHEYNTLPPNLKEVSNTYFLSQIANNTILREENRQPLDWRSKPKGVSSLRMLHFYDNTGIAIAEVRQQESNKYYLYKFGCDHEYREIFRIGLTKHYECSLCHHEQIIDSSD